MDHNLTVRNSIYELLIQILVHSGQYYLLNQLTAYKVIKDSKPIAFILLSLEDEYPPAVQLALDMLRRLPLSCEDIVEIFLIKKKVLHAIRFLESVAYAGQRNKAKKGDDHNMAVAASARQYLEVAMSVNDPKVFHSVYTFFRLRNQLLRGSPAFAPTEHCDKYVDHFEALFGDENDLTNTVHRTSLS